ncbi:unnamed protein product [Heligmosomoides polygyrus]|uniref:Nucleic-acid-binding protein from transposon X-element n=1 Tax=Heligmosomoides polygyrus TaxID=6339 RepID=A0A183GJP7_HELPZ|nr:unnamed protein product [Heligmosomoides polygyrus]
MTNYEPLLDADLLHTELLKTIDKKSDHICLKLVDFVSVIVTRLDKIDKSPKRLSSMPDALQELRTLKPAISAFIERTRPKSAYIFCTVKDNLDSHPSGRCTRFSAPYARTFQVLKMGLCGHCSKPAHGEECMVTCNVCRQPHNALLCPGRMGPHPKKNKLRPSSFVSYYYSSSSSSFSSTFIRQKRLP